MIRLAVLIHNLQMTGIPSQPIVENCTNNNDGALLLVIECKYPGVPLDDPSLKINVRSYGGVEQLRGLSRRIPALAMAIGLEKQRG